MKKMIKRLLCLVLSIILVCSSMTSVIASESENNDVESEILDNEFVPELGSEEDNIEIPNKDDGIDLLDDVENEEEEWEKLTSDGGELESGYYILNENIKLKKDINIPENKDVTIDLNGYTLTGTSAGSVITNYGTLILIDYSVNKTGMITGGAGGANGGGVYNSGTFYMVDVKICGNSANNGGGVYNAYSGSFTMYGGEISNNQASNYGGGVYNDAYYGNHSNQVGSFTMYGGEISNNNAYRGGGIYNANVYTGTRYIGGIVNIYGSSISNNSSDYSGGGIYCSGSGCELNIFESYINNNSSDYSGGGIYCSGDTVIKDSEVCGNIASMSGGGIGTGMASFITITNCKINNNEAGRYGGGISNGSSLTINGGEITQNKSGWEGGGIYCNTHFTLNNVKINENETSKSGGGIYLNDTYGELNNCEISYNTSASNGGGISLFSYYDYDGADFLTVTDCKIDGNNSSGAGGGIFIGDKFILIMENGEISENSADKDGGGIYKEGEGQFSVKGSAVISGNTVSEMKNNFYTEYSSYYPLRQYITLDNELTEGASIGVTTANKPTVNNSVQITSTETETEYYKNSAKYFFSDEGYSVRANNEGEYVEIYYDGPTVTYNANGGTGSVPTDTGGYTEGETVTVQGADGLSRDGYHFTGWNTSADGTGTTYQEGNTFQITENVVLYAQWEAHSYASDNVTFDWSDDFTTCKALAKCVVCDETTELDCFVTSMTTAPTCTAEGSTIYTASVTIGEENYTDEKSESISALGHKFSGDPAYVTFAWTNDSLGSLDDVSCIATFKCTDCDYAEDVICEIEADYSKSSATCTELGEILLTATAKIESRDGKVSASEENTIEVAALGHDWVVTFEWDENNYSATYSAVCKRDSSHTDSGEAEITSETTKAPTCTDSGVETYTASVTIDNEKYTDTMEGKIDPLGHDYVGIVTEPTCTESGYTTYTCSRCGDTYKDYYTDPLGHSWEKVVWGEWIESDDGGWVISASRTCNRCYETEDLDVTIERTTTDADCTTPGTIIYTASVTVDGETFECPDSKTVTGVALGHDWYYGDEDVTWSGSPEKGYTCTISFTCKNDNSHVETVTASVNKDSEKSVEPTCGEEGKYVYTASFADPDGNRSYTESYEVTVAATGEHEYDYDSAEYVWSDNYDSCIITAACINCDAKREITVTDIDVNVDNAEPTCTEDGTVTYSFEYFDEISGITFTDSITVKVEDATGHTAVTDPAVDPTCTETGLTEGSRCSVCGEVLVAQEVVPALGHDYVGTVTTYPTCTEAGEMTYVCSRCQDEYTEEIPALGHDWVETEIVITNDDGTTMTTIIIECSRGDEIKTVDSVVSGVISEGVTAEASVDWNDVISAQDLADLFEDDEDEIAGIDISLTVEDYNDAVPENDRDLTEDKIEQLWSGQDYSVFYLDIEVVMHIMHTDGSEDEIMFTQTVNPITITVTIPEELIDADGDIYSIIRIHDGEAAVIECTDNGDGTLTFSTDLFSTYAIVKTAAAAETEPGTGDEDIDDTSDNDNGNGSGDGSGSGAGAGTGFEGSDDDTANGETGSGGSASGETAENSNSADTSDSSSPMMMLMLLILSCMGIAFLTLRRKTEE